MRKIILFNLITLDGYFEGPGDDISWHNVDEEFNEFAIEQLNAADTLLFGRKTYQLMESYWPTSEAIKNDPIVAGIMNRFDKIVFSKTLEKADWNNTKLIRENPVEQVRKLRSEQGKDVFIFGSADLCTTFIQHNLIDEFRIMINPVILGKGNSLFKNIEQKIELKLLKTKVFGNGNVLLYYILKK